MILNKTGFGVLVTDDFGGRLRRNVNLYQICTELHADENEDFLFSCPSAEDYQLVFGFSTKINKHTDFKALEIKWNELLSSAPEELKNAWLADGSPEPDVVFLSGKC